MRGGSTGWIGLCPTTRGEEPPQHCLFNLTSTSLLSSVLFNRTLCCCNHSLICSKGTIKRNLRSEVDLNISSACWFYPLHLSSSSYAAFPDLLLSLGNFFFHAVFVSPAPPCNQHAGAAEGSGKRVPGQLT